MRLQKKFPTYKKEKEEQIMEPETECVNLSEEDINEILDAAMIVKNTTAPEENIKDKMLTFLLFPGVMNAIICLGNPTNGKLGVLCGILTVGWFFSAWFLIVTEKMKRDQALDFINEMTSFCKHGTVCNKIECPFFNSGKCELGYEVIFQNETDSYISQKIIMDRKEE